MNHKMYSTYIMRRSTSFEHWCCCSWKCFIKSMLRFIKCTTLRGDRKVFEQCLLLIAIFLIIKNIYDTYLFLIASMCRKNKSMPTGRFSAFNLFWSYQWIYEHTSLTGTKVHSDVCFFTKIYSPQQRNELSSCNRLSYCNHKPWKNLLCCSFSKAWW